MTPFTLILHSPAYQAEKTSVSDTTTLSAEAAITQLQAEL